MQRLEVPEAGKRKESVNKGIVADIQRASVHDGAGIRTTVFLKGCPLHCAWCHNPECIDRKPQLMYYPEKCIGCGLCQKGCFSGAKVLCGKEMTAEEVVEQVLLDRDYYGKEGGVTFSGGEPLEQKVFLNEMIDLCRNNEIGCALETSLFYFEESIFKKCDFIMADLKIWNEELHKTYTGVSNRIIKENFRRLNELGVPIIARTPVIPEIEQEISEIALFLKELKNVKRYELLPYHPLGKTKRKALGLQEESFSVPSKERWKELEQYVFIR